MTEFQDLHDHLKFLDEQATPFPWEVGAAKAGEDAPIKACVCGFRQEPGQPMSEVIVAESEGNTTNDDYDMELIAALRNNLPQILAALKAQRDEAGG